MVGARAATPAVRFAASALAVVLTACFPTIQPARIDPGFRLDVGMTALADQSRNGVAQGADVLLYGGPAYGFGRRVEIGVPVGTYLEEVTATDRYARNFVVWPYVKLALLGPESRQHLALIAQSALIAPANVGVRYGYDLGRWEPYGGVSVVFSGGPAGDDQFVTRYQEKSQSLIVALAGATWNAPGRPGIELGVLRNRYDEGAVFGDFGQATQMRTLYDVYAAVRITAVRW